MTFSLALGRLASYSLTNWSRAFSACASGAAGLGRFGQGVHDASHFEHPALYRGRSRRARRRTREGTVTGGEHRGCHVRPLQPAQQVGPTSQSTLSARRRQTRSLVPSDRVPTMTRAHRRASRRGTLKSMPRHTRRHSVIRRTGRIRAASQSFRRLITDDECSAAEPTNPLGRRRSHPSSPVQVHQGQHLGHSAGLARSRSQ